MSPTMGERDGPPGSPFTTARTGPARASSPDRPVTNTHAGLVLLYSPSFRTMAPAYAFDRPEIVIGRDPLCAVVLDDHAVSRHHARIFHKDGVFRITDLGSRNGTLLDGERLREAVLEPLQELRIGDALFKFVDRDAEEYAHFRLDGAVDGSMPEEIRAALGGLTIRRAEAELARIAPTELSCIILGETGTGKEVFAREMHRLSGRPGAFLAIHCAAIPEGLLESELFGFRRGAFSGAHRDKPGLVQQAHEGTLFLDEIGDMPLDMQVKLLRVLQSHEVTALGSTQPDKVDLRVVCATHRDLPRLVQEGKFRGDLFARLNEHVTVLPPLRERKEDIFALTQAFIARAGKRVEASFAFVMALLQHDWPFNVRELQSAIKRAVALAEAGVLEPRHLPPAVLEASQAGGPVQPGASRGAAAPAEKSTRPIDAMGASLRSDPHGSPPAGAPSDGFLRGAPTEETMRALLARHKGNVAAIAREVGKARMQVHRWVRRYGLSVEDYRSR
jgi:DNA-binding NtrC family response regulator